LESVGFSIGRGGVDKRNVCVPCEDLGLNLIKYLMYISSSPLSPREVKVYYFESIKRRKFSPRLFSLPFSLPLSQVLLPVRRRGGK